MKFRILKEKITPDIPVLQMGFAVRTHKSVGVHDDPYVSVVLIQANETVLIISLDLIYGDRSFAYGIKDAIYKKYGLSQDKIIINFSHTHSVVAVTGEDFEKRAERPYCMAGDSFMWDKDKNEVDYTEDIRYYNMIKKKVITMIDEGIKNPIDGDVYILKGKSQFGVSRRFPSEEGILWRPYFNEDCMDPDLFLLKFVDKNNNIKGLIYNYACHPTALSYDNYLLSADFPGVVRRILEEKNMGMTAVFLQGCGADIKPYISAEKDKFKSCNFDELEQGGITLANEIQGYIEKPDWRKLDLEIETGYSDVKLYTETWGMEKWQATLDNPNEVFYRKLSIIKIMSSIKANRVKNYLPYYISFLRLDKKTCFICLESEVVSEIGKKIKKLFDDDIITLGYSNSIACYIPTKAVLRDGGYERESFIGARLAGPFVPEVEDIVVGKAAMLVKYGNNPCIK